MIMLDLWQRDKECPVGCFNASYVVVQLSSGSDSRKRGYDRVGGHSLKLGSAS